MSLSKRLIEEKAGVLAEAFASDLQGDLWMLFLNILTVVPAEHLESIFDGVIESREMKELLGELLPKRKKR